MRPEQRHNGTAARRGESFFGGQGPSANSRGTPFCIRILSSRWVRGVRADRRVGCGGACSNATGGQCHALVHDELLFVSGRPGCWEFGDRHGRALRGQVSESGVVLQAESTAVDSAARKPTDVARLTSVDDIPDEIDSEWWHRHAHLLEWTSNGKGIRLRRDPSGDRSA